MKRKPPKRRAKRETTEDQVNQFQKLETIGLLASGIAHDFNNLLTSIRGSVALALSEIGHKHASAGNLLDAERAARCGMELVNQLLGFVRQTDTSPRGVLSLNNHIEEVTGFLKHLIDSKVDIRCELDRNLGNIRAAPGPISQILMNLCLNAADAMPSGGTIVLRTENVSGSPRAARRTSHGNPQSSQEWIAVSVSDTGHGMDRKTLRHIYEPFFTSKGGGKGTGLGLMVVRNLVTRNGGAIEVRSQPGKGTTFCVRFPRSRSTATAARATAATPVEMHPAISSPALTGDGEAILLVENDDLVRTVSQKILARAGYQVLEAGDGLEALAAFQHSRTILALIVLDLNLPKKSGREVLAEIRKQGHDLPVILSSGFRLELPKEDLARLGVAGVLLKPYLPSEFLAMVKRHLHRRKAAGNGKRTFAPLVDASSRCAICEGRQAAE